MCRICYFHLAHSLRSCILYEDLYQYPGKSYLVIKTSNVRLADKSSAYYICSSLSASATLLVLVIWSPHAVNPY